MSTFTGAVKQFFTKYATFCGRSSRSDYWWVVLFNFLVQTALFILFGGSLVSSISALAKNVNDPLALSGLIGFYSVMGLYSLAILLPSLALIVRRLHDTGRGGGWIFISFVPLIGGIWLFILMLLDSEPYENRFGPNPNAENVNF